MATSKQNTGTGSFAITRKSGWSMVAAVIAAMAAISVIHTYFVVPAVVAQARLEWRKDIRESLKSKDTELDGVRRELDASRQQSMEQYRSMTQRLDRMDTRQMRIEDKLDRALEKK